MTVEKKTLISLKDILAIEYGCPYCLSKYTIPLNKFDQAVSKCPNCKKDLIGTEGLAPDDMAVRGLVMALREVTNRKIGDALRLEIANICDTKIA